ncbi:MAG TPA: ISL3 family transposase, partial [Methylomicrobium sp.]|nr:ISL3 family transposase [Methylomicrobium sp.]
MSKAQITIPLDIPDVRVLQTSVNERGEIIITIESTKVGTTCRRCGKWITKLHGQDEWVMIRHLPAFGRPSYLRYRPRRYQCQDCEGHPTTTQSLNWHDANSPHSFAYDNHVLLQLVHSTVEDVSVKAGLSYESVAGVLERRIEARVDWTEMADIELLGLDEIALRKGQGNYVTLVTGRFREGEMVLLGVLPGHEKAVVVEFLRLIPQRILQRVQAVCCDLWEAYTEAVREEIPTARIVADRFHVARHYREAADDLRKQELHRLKKELPPEDYQKLKGSMHAFRKNARDLNREERKTLKSFFQHAASAKQAYTLRERLTAIFDRSLSQKQAQANLRRWVQQVRKSGLHCFDRFLNLLDTWWQEITNYFIQRENSGFVEGFNNKVKVLKRRCYGIFNLKHLFQRIYLDLHGYRLFAATTISG